MEEQFIAQGAVKDWTITLVPDQVIPALREGGMTDEQQTTMMEENPKRWLVGYPSGRPAGRLVPWPIYHLQSRAGVV